MDDNPSGVDNEVEETQDGNEAPPPAAPQDIPPLPSTENPRRSARNQNQNVSYRGVKATFEEVEPSTSYIFEESFDFLPECFNTAVNHGPDPKSFKKAMESDDFKLWKVACDKEWDSLEKKGVWTLVDRPTNKSVIRGMWIFRRKPQPDNSFKFKAQYVAMGNTQVPGVDYGDTFAPTGKPSSLRILVAVAAVMGWEIHQMDAVTAFLNGILSEELYVEIPEGYRKQEWRNKVWLMNKSLYGFKQSPKIWQDDVEEFLISAGFIKCLVDHCIYIRADSAKETFTAIYVHVDDLAITGNDIESFKLEISRKWEMEDLGLARVVVGIEVSRPSDHSYSLCQERFALAILERFGMLESKSASTPLSPNCKLMRSSDEEAATFAKKKLPYRRVVGSIMYLAQCTRPDLAHAVGTLSQHLERPSSAHWEAALHVLRYLRGTTKLGIVYSSSNSIVVSGQKSFERPTSRCDADWAGDPSTRRSTTGYIFVLAGGAISWRSRLQPTVALSSTEAEYWAVTEAGQELVWLRNMMSVFGYTDPNPTVLQSDNMGAIHLTSKSIFHARTKHIEIHYHWIREAVKRGDLQVKYCPTEIMAADLLTKQLSRQQFVKLRGMLGVKFIS